MLSRRQFLVASPAGAGFLQAAAPQAGLPIRHVDIVHHTHADVGYTALPAVVRDLQKRYLDVALDACRLEMAEPMVLMNPAVREPPPIVNRLYRP